MDVFQVVATQIEAVEWTNVAHEGHSVQMAITYAEDAQIWIVLLDLYHPHVADEDILQ